MQTFVNDYGLDKTRDADRYQMVRDIYFGGIVACLANCPLEEVTKENLLVGVENYLHNGGMEEAEVAKLPNEKASTNRTNWQ